VSSALVPRAFAEPKCLAQSLTSVVPPTHAPALNGVESPEPGVVFMEAASFSQQEQRLSRVAANAVAASPVEMVLKARAVG
jgi:hypothetical protein